MIFHSIRWRLQLWYGLMLVAILVGFGITACQLERNQQLRTIGEELRRRVGILLQGLGRPRAGDFGPDRQFPNQPPPPDGPPDEAPPGQDRGEADARGRGPQRGQFRLPPASAALFADGETNAFYFVIWRRDGTELTRSTNAPANIPRPPPPNPGTPELPRARGELREIFQTTPLGECVLAGRSISGDLAELRKFAWWLTAAGGVVLLCGLAGGWWLAARAIRPIEDISAAAVKIAAGDLSQRIDLEDTENELGRLAALLNSTFARLEAAFAQQGQFTADAAHELRTPVTVILTQTQTVLKHERDAADYKQTVEACQRSAQKMRRLLESLLELARLDAGQEPMKQQRFDLAGTVRDCVEHIQSLASERQIKIEIDLPALECTGDPERLGQVVTNLLTNAIHYNKDHGEVRVSVKAQNGSAFVTVTDTGVGISGEDLPHVFERFYRADKSRSNAAGRNGLGLSISKAIVEAHGGNIEASSKPAVGTIFTVRLPGQA